MRLVDANILVYAHVAAFERHAAASSWLDDKLGGLEPLGIPWASLLSFIRLVSNPRIFEKPEPIKLAWKQAAEWLDCRASWIPLPTDRHRSILDGFFAIASEGGNIVPDAHLAALAIEHGLILCSTDTDFSRFPGLRWENPLR
jgi:toxin-antitoxin system PIN domain toxin